MPLAHTSLVVLCLSAGFGVGCVGGDEDSVRPRDSRQNRPDDTQDSSEDSSPDSTDATAPPVPACAAYGPSAQLGTVVDETLNEISGIAVSRRNPEVLWVHEDHGGLNEIYALDHTGASLGKVVLEGVENNDWEDLAVGVCGDSTCVYVGETGDNDFDRTFHAVYRFPEPEVPLTGGLELAVIPETFAYTWPDGGFHDAEALAVLADGTPVIFTKEFSLETSTAHRFPVLDSAQTVVLIEGATFSTGESGDGGGAATTAADLWPDDSHLLLRTYAHIWDFSTGGSLDSLADAPRAEWHTGSERQGEAMAFDPPARGFWTVGEGVSSPLWFTGCGDPTVH